MHLAGWSPPCAICASTPTTAGLPAVFGVYSPSAPFFACAPLRLVFSLRRSFFFVRAPSWLAFSLCRSFPCLLVHRAGCSSPCFLCHCFLFFFVRLAGWSSPRATCFFLFVCAPSRLVSSLRLVRTSPSCWPSDAYWRVLSLRHSLFSFVQQAGVRISTGCWPSGSFWVYSLCATRFFFFVRLAGWPSPCSTLLFFAVRANIGP